MGLGAFDDLRTTLEVLADSARRALGAERATCYAYDVESQVVSAVFTTEADPVRRAFLERAVGRGPDLLPIWRLQLSHQDPLLVVEDVTRHPDVSEPLARRLHAGALLGVRLEHTSVLRTEDTPVHLGTLFCSYPEPRRFSPADLQAARGLANLAALALANARLHAGAVAMAAEQAALRRVATAVASAEPQEVFSVVAEEVAKLMGADAGGVVRFEDDQWGTLVGSWTAGDEPRQIGANRLPLTGKGASALVFRTGLTARVDDYESLDEDTARIVDPFPYTSGIAAPIRVGSPLWGALVAVTDRTDPFPTGSEDRLGQFAELVAVGVANAEARAELAFQATTDPLTSLPNRRALESRLEDAVEHARREGRMLSLLVLDLDGFKKVNDSQGHASGDAVLRATARTLESALRPGDTAGRLGGEEFLVLLPDTSAKAAWFVAERLRVAVTAQAAFEEGAPTVTASFGIASFPAHGSSAGELLRAADVAMYEAKALGRDRTVVFTTHHPAGDQRPTPALASSDGFLGSVLALAAAIDARDPSTYHHSQTVARYAAAIAAHLGFDDERVEEVRIAGLLHDVGKVGVSDAILHKPGPLTDDEWVEMHRHSEIGARIVAHPELASVREWILCHHEQPNGLGYPHGLTAPHIPLEAGILAVADAYEAMTSDRPYRRGRTPDAARAQLEAGRGSQFDSQIVDAFIALLDAATPTPATPAQLAGPGRPLSAQLILPAA